MPPASSAPNTKPPVGPVRAHAPWVALAALVPALFAVTPPVLAEGSVAQVSSRLFVEASGRVDGQGGTRLAPVPDRLNRGDRLIVFVRFNLPPESRSAFVTSPVPSGLRFDGASAGAELSNDGGRRFRPGDALLAGDGTALNTVTHVRWRVRGDGVRGALSFRGVVR